MIEDSISLIIPEIRRCRDYRLYGKDNRRYLDFFQAGGTAILGHRPKRVTMNIKNTLSKGLIADYPSAWQRRLRKHISYLFPGYRQICIFGHKAEFQSFIHRNFEKELEFKDPAFGEVSKDDAALWRPFCAFPGEPVRLLMPILPFPGQDKPVVMCIRDKADCSKDWAAEISPAFAAAMICALSNMKKNADTFVINNKWELFDNPLWERRGPYLLFTKSKQEYKKLFSQALGAGVLLSPYYPGPSIIPMEYSEGELKAYHRLMKQYGNTTTG